MKRLKKGGTVEELIGRARMLRPDARPRWGRLSARQMLCHVSDVARLVLGEIPVRPRDPARRPRNRPFSRFPTGIGCCTGTRTTISGSSGSESRMRRAPLRAGRN